MDTQLAQLLKFDNTDLAQNRNGQLSAAQKSRLARDAYGSLAITAIALIGLLWALLTPASTFANPLLMRSIYSVIALTITSIGLIVYRRESAALRAGNVGSVQGTPRFEKRRSIRRIQVDGVELWVTRGLERAFADDNHYTFYYLEGSPILLSAEPISQPE